LFFFLLEHPKQKSGEIGHSLATDLLEEFGPDDDVRDALGILYLGGADTVCPERTF
jgi:hypothetical protein